MACHHSKRAEHRPSRGVALPPGTAPVRSGAVHARHTPPGVSTGLRVRQAMANAGVGAPECRRQSSSFPLPLGCCARLKFPSPDFPAPPEGDIEGQQNQAEVKPEILSVDIKKIITELVPSRDIAISEDLGHPRQAWSDRQASLESRDRLIWQFFVWPFS